MTFVDSLKEKINKRGRNETYEFADEVRKNPKYAPAIEKLRLLILEREELIKTLRKIEVDIDACLIIISLAREKEDIDTDGKKKD